LGKGAKMMLEMKKRILTLIKEYMKNGKDIDEEYIVRLIKILVEFRSLENYVNTSRISFDDRLPSVAKFYFEGKGIKINLSELKTEIDDYRGIIGIDELTSLYCSHAITNEVFAHETDHADHLRIIDSERRDQLANILRATYGLSDRDIMSDISMKEKNAIYMNFHSLAPEERLADGYAYDLVCDILRRLNREEAGALNILEASYRFIALDELLESYDESEALFGTEEGDSVGPTFGYFQLMSLKNIEDLSNSLGTLPLKDRFLLGLSLSKQELKTLYGLEDSLEKRISYYKK